MDIDKVEVPVEAIKRNLIELNIYIQKLPIRLKIDEMGLSECADSCTKTVIVRKIVNMFWMF